jgi:hypothetical protein
MSIAMWRILYNSGQFEPDTIGLVLVHGHMFCCYHHKDNDFYVLDNGYLSPGTIQLASSLFPVTRKGTLLNPLIGFNLDKAWKYKPVK